MGVLTILLIREYVYLGGQPLAMLAKDPKTGAEAIYYLHTDHLGAVVKASDADQSLVWDAKRRPFGERVVSVELIEMPLGFPGQYYDQETGNYYNYFRDYDPTTGRYLQSDPIGLAGGLNTYAYVENNPLTKIDKLGLYGYGGTIDPEFKPKSKRPANYEWAQCERKCDDFSFNECMNNCYTQHNPWFTTTAAAGAGHFLGSVGKGAGYYTGWELFRCLEGCYFDKCSFDK